MIWTEDTLRIRNKDIPVKIGMIDQRSLQFFADNPRIYSIVRSDDREPEQENIQRELLKMDHVKALVQDIKLNGGLMDPVVVRSGTLEVLEGNSRLAAYRALAEKDPIKWGKIKCQLLPDDIEESDIFAFLGQYHIKGKKDWAPYEQAGFLYRRHKNHKIPVTVLGQELGLGRLRASQLIQTYQFMIDNNDNDVSRWSYYEEFLKSKKIKKLRENNVGFDDFIVEQIKSGAISKAVEIRDDLPKLVSAPQKIVKRFIAHEISLEEAVELADRSGGTDSTYQRLHRFRKWLVQPETEEGILKATGSAGDKIQFEVGKLHTAFRRLAKASAKTR